MKKTKDNFSEQSGLYQKFRPGYPMALVEALCDRIAGRGLAWDCATGNGQMATLLSKRFAQVVATDISGEQLGKTGQRENVSYRVERAENSTLPDASVDLLTVAQAIHWFDFDSFYLEAKRVMKEDAVIATIGYPLLTTENPKLDKIIRYFYKDVIGKYWDAERRYLDERYTTIPFPFEEFQMPIFEIKYNWTLEQLAGYLESWSAVAHYRRKNGTNPLKHIKTPLDKIFDGGKPVEVRFEIMGRYGRA